MTEPRSYELTHEQVLEICQALKFHANSLDHLEGSGVGVARCALSATCRRASACYFYFEEEPGRPVGAKLLTMTRPAGSPPTLQARSLVSRSKGLSWPRKAGRPHGLPSGEAALDDGRLRGDTHAFAPEKT